MLEAYLASLWNPNDERAIPSPFEKDRTQSIIDELQRKLDVENSIISENFEKILTQSTIDELQRGLDLENLITGNTLEMIVDHQWRARMLEGELQKRKLFIAPIRGVPDDVLLEILDLALIGDRRQIWTFSHVCRHWRHICCSYTRLWSHIEVDLDVDRPPVGLVSKWRERVWGINQTIDLQLHLEQFGALKGMLEGGLKYITHLRLTIPIVAKAPVKLDLPPALPCLRHLALNNGDVENPFSFFEAKVYVTSLCHRFFTRRQTRRTCSLARFHLEFYNLAFKNPPRVMNCVHTVVLRACTFEGSSQILQFLEVAKFTIKHLEYIRCYIRPLGTLSHTQPLILPSLLTLKHYTSDPTQQFSILSILSCPALKSLTIFEEEAILCTVAQYPAIQELYLFKWDFRDVSHIDCPLVRDSKQLETLTISQPSPTVSFPDPSPIVRHYKHMNPDIYARSLCHLRFHFPNARGSAEVFESGLQEVANDLARRGRNIQFELIRGDWDIIF